MNRSSVVRRLAVVAVSLLTAATFTGCAKPEIVPSSGSHAATTMQQVKIYEKAPNKKYEILGVVTATKEEGAQWDNRGDANAGFDAMLKKAAALGANGVLLKVDPGQSDRYATAGYHGTFYQVPILGTPGVAKAQAIYVHEKK